MSLKNEILPKGIRKRGDTYQWSRQINGERKFGTALTLKQAIKARENAHIEIQAFFDKKTKTDTVHKMTVEEGIKEVLANYEASARPSTYTNALSAYKTIAREFGKDKLLTEISTQEIDLFIRRLKAKNLKNGTINVRLVFLSKLISTAKDYNWIETVPSIHWLKNNNGRIRYFTQEEEESILANIDTFCKDVIITLIDTGMRKGEVLGLKAENINLESKKISVWKTKTGRPRLIPMTKRVESILTERLKTINDPEQLVFPVSVAQLQYSWEKMRKKAGFDWDPDFVIHACRHTCASRMIKNGVSIAIVKKWLGHDNISTTMRYAHLDDDDLVQALDALN